MRYTKKDPSKSHLNHMNLPRSINFLSQGAGFTSRSQILDMMIEYTINAPNISWDCGEIQMITGLSWATVYRGCEQLEIEGLIIVNVDVDSTERGPKRAIYNLNIDSPLIKTYIMAIRYYSSIIKEEIKKDEPVGEIVDNGELVEGVKEQLNLQGNDIIDSDKIVEPKPIDEEKEKEFINSIIG